MDRAPDGGRRGRCWRQNLRGAKATQLVGVGSRANHRISRAPMWAGGRCASGARGRAHDVDVTGWSQPRARACERRIHPKYCGPRTEPGPSSSLSSGRAKGGRADCGGGGGGGGGRCRRVTSSKPSSLRGPLSSRQAARPGSWPPLRLLCARFVRLSPGLCGSFFCFC